MSRNIELLLKDWEKTGDKPHAANIAFAPDPWDAKRCSVYQDGIATLWLRQGEDWVVVSYEVVK